MHHVLLRCLPGGRRLGKECLGEETGGNSGLRKEGGDTGKRVLRPEGCSLVTPGGAGPLTSSFPTVAMQDNDLYSALKRPEQHS